MPFLNNYTYRIVTVYNDVRLYPATVVPDFGSRSPSKVGSEAELLSVLKRILNDDDTKRIIVGLMSEARAL